MTKTYFANLSLPGTRFRMSLRGALATKQSH